MGQGWTSKVHLGFFRGWELEVSCGPCSIPSPKILDSPKHPGRILRGQSSICQAVVPNTVWSSDGFMTTFEDSPDQPRQGGDLEIHTGSTVE